MENLKILGEDSIHAAQNKLKKAREEAVRAALTDILEKIIPAAAAAS